MFFMPKIKPVKKAVPFNELPMCLVHGLDELLGSRQSRNNRAFEGLAKGASAFGVFGLFSLRLVKEEFRIPYVYGNMIFGSLLGFFFAKDVCQTRKLEK